ncbi:uncharacterized protein N7459_002210 [Penicillium hispanicum]|uniref:uncharacterized protein n=1 Tax=Penicillium hispanicum TaxID=1080232 RepID=UPI00254107EA|nr:uncharacterized protein N7459_002210 [Penicillium hispanicum]KAJ5591841.1 hypothetical protein N7459_002210 [Penicillium hispanicum]
MGTSSKVLLVPWDPDSVAHRDYLLRQREECGWQQDKVENVWREAQTRGEKCIYWIVIVKVLPSDDSQTVDSNTSKEKSTLQDTAVAINAVPREPTQKSFIPVGHISLDNGNPDAAKIDLGLPTEGVFWIKTFYVSQSIQGQGIGRAAMDEVEDMATREPINAKILMLDTVQKDDQRRNEHAKANHGGAPKVTNEEWYSRRGYRLIKTVQNYYPVADEDSEARGTRAVFMRRDIS